MFTLDDESDLDNVSSGLWLDICIQIPDEEKDLGAHDRLIHVYHFSRDASQNHMVWSCFIALFGFLKSDSCESWYPSCSCDSTLKLTLGCKLQVQNFGEPFFLVVHETETLAEVKQCIQRKLEIPYEEFSKVCSQSPRLCMIQLTLST